MGDFKKLDVWHMASGLAVRAEKVARRIGKQDPRLADQLRRSATAVPAMIAEGSGLGTDKAFANKVSEAKGEVSEVESHAQVGFDSCVLLRDEYLDLTKRAIAVRRKLIGLHRTLLGQPRRSHPPDSQPQPEP